MCHGKFDQYEECTRENFALNIPNPHHVSSLLQLREYLKHQTLVLLETIVDEDVTSQGVLYLGAPFIFAALSRWPQSRRGCTYVGIGIMIVALILSSFATKVWHLILSQGVLYSLGGGIAYSPMILFVHEWFIRKKGVAFGIMWVSSSWPLGFTQILTFSPSQGWNFRCWCCSSSGHDFTFRTLRLPYSAPCLGDCGCSLMLSTALICKASSAHFDLSSSNSLDFVETTLRSLLPVVFLFPYSSSLQRH
jgi:MFS family permease